MNGFLRNTNKPFDQSQWTVAKAMQRAGYETAVVGKWHLKAEPVGFDFWEVLPGQGNYYNPVYLKMDGSRQQAEGYVTDITTTRCLEWLSARTGDQPFFLMCQFKAPHRTFAPALRHLGALDEQSIPEPPTLFDDYANRSAVLSANEMEIDRHMTWAYDLKIRQEEQQNAELPRWRKYGSPEYKRMTAAQKAEWDAHFGPKNREFVRQFKAGELDAKALVRWKYQRYVRNYLETVRAVDDNVGRLLDYLDENGLTKDTVVIYSSDQGFYLGEHGWFDKRWMFEESFRMPFIVRWPGTIRPGARPAGLIQNIDYAPTFMEIAGEPIPEQIQGHSLVPIMRDETASVRNTLYYAYYEIGEHAVPQHFGVRTDTQKLFYLPATEEWQMFDLQADPHELRNVYDDPAYAKDAKELKRQYHLLRKQFGAPSYEEYMNRNQAARR